MGANTSQPVHDSYGEERKPNRSPTFSTILGKPSLALQTVNFIPRLGKRSQALGSATPATPQTPMTVPQIHVEPAPEPELPVTGPADRTETAIDVNPVFEAKVVTDLVLLYCPSAFPPPPTLNSRLNSLDKTSLCRLRR